MPDAEEGTEGEASIEEDIKVHQLITDSHQLITNGIRIY